MEIEEESKFKDKMENQKFITFMNMSFEANTRHSVGLETLWDVG